MSTIQARQVADAFYKAFERKDGAAMAAAYAPGAVFSDPVFPALHDGEPGAMWQMLSKSEDLKLDHKIVRVDGDVVTAEWTARYKFPANGNAIVNKVTSHLTIKDGKITEHHDEFDMHAWLTQAYGMAAALPFADAVLGHVTRHFAARQLRSFMQNGG